MTEPKAQIRVLIVDDSAFMRRALSAIIESDASLELVGTAFNGRNGLEKIEKLKPDVVTLDIEMPVLNGIGALKELMASHDHPPAVLMCSSLTTAGSDMALEALQHGAADIIAKPTTASGVHQSPDARLMLAKIRGLAANRGRLSRLARASASRTDAASTGPTKRIERTSRGIMPRLATPGCVVIGSSTGGPPALERMLAHVPAECSFPIIIAQHMPPMFTQSLASRLDAQCDIKVVHAETGMPLLPGTAYVAQGGRHLRVARVGAGRTRLEVAAEPAEALYKPSVNVLFESAAKVFGSSTLGVMLTGMGDDGLEGARSLVAAGGTLLGQDEDSSVVYGMPRAVHEAQLVKWQSDPMGLGKGIAQLGISAVNRCKSGSAA
ncbi:MAG: chemotaxis response regulator protein-glutamate methylesterase [Planctomycetota bacterium]